MKSFRFICAAAALGLAAAGCSSEESLTAIKLTPKSTTIDTGEIVTIDIVTTPADIALTSENVETSGGIYTVSEDTISFKADSPGAYDIYAFKGDVKSPIVTITVYDKKDSSTSKDTTNSDSDTDSQTYEYGEGVLTVDEVMVQGPELIASGDVIAVGGLLPQALMEDEAGNLVAVIWNDSMTEYIVLNDEDGLVNVGNMHAVVYGTLGFEDDSYVLNVTEIEPLE